MTRKTRKTHNHRMKPQASGTKIPQDITGQSTHGPACLSTRSCLPTHTPSLLGNVSPDASTDLLSTVPNMKHVCCSYAEQPCAKTRHVCRGAKPIKGNRQNNKPTCHRQGLCP